MSKSPFRSFEKILPEDLTRLARIAWADLIGLCERTEYCRPYADRLRIIVLAQGAARHYIYGDRGVQDFDVWGFFEALPNREFPTRRMGKYDFGASRFGRNPDDNFVGRRVDVMGRSIMLPATLCESIWRYLREGRSNSSRFLAERPAIAIWPEFICGKVIWDPKI